MTELITTIAAAQRLGISRNHLLTFLHRHPELKPAARIQGGRHGIYLWTEEEVRRIEQHRNKEGE